MPSAPPSVVTLGQREASWLVEEHETKETCIQQKMPICTIPEMAERVRLSSCPVAAIPIVNRAITNLLGPGRFR